MQIRTSVIRYFYVILTIEYVSGILVMIQCHFQGQMKVEWVKIWLFNK